MVIATINQKGGVGKTTSTINLSGFFADKGYKTLIIDMDSQQDSTTSLGFDLDNLNYTTYDLLKETDFNKIEFLKYNDNLFIIPAHEFLNEVSLSRKMLLDKIDYLRKQFDIILIDCNPHSILNSRITLNEVILIASDGIIIPIDSNINSLKSANKIMLPVNNIRNNYNKNLKVLGFFMTDINPQTDLFQEIYAEMKNHSNLLFNTFIRRDERIKKAQSLGITIFDYDRKSRSCIDYENLGYEIVQHFN